MELVWGRVKAFSGALAPDKPSPQEMDTWPGAQEHNKGPEEPAKGQLRTRQSLAQSSLEGPGMADQRVEVGL